MPEAGNLQTSPHLIFLSEISISLCLLLSLIILFFLSIIWAIKALTRAFNSFHYCHHATLRCLRKWRALLPIHYAADFTRDYTNYWVVPVCVTSFCFPLTGQWARIFATNITAFTSVRFCDLGLWRSNLAMFWLWTLKTLLVLVIYFVAWLTSLFFYLSYFVRSGI